MNHYMYLFSIVQKPVFHVVSLSFFQGMDIETNYVMQCCLRLKILLSQSLKCIPDFLLLIFINGEEKKE